MSSFYTLPPVLIILLPVLLGLALLAQTGLVIHGVYRMTHSLESKLAIAAEGVLGTHILWLIVLAAQTSYQLESGFFILHSGRVPGYIAAAVSACLCLYLSFRKKQPGFLVIPVSLAITLPVVEKWIGYGFAWGLLLLTLVWIARAIFLLVRSRKNAAQQLSVFSVKQATDAMDFGLLFCKSQGFSDGQILLCNRKMEELMTILTQRVCFNGKAFYRQLEAGDTNPLCEKYASPGLLLYRLPDNRVWSFRLTSLTIRKKSYALLMAFDDTGIYEATRQLQSRDTTLQEQNRELRQVLSDMEHTCRMEEILHMKGQIHDLLGQKITLLLRSMREHKPIDRELLDSIANGLSEALETQAITGDYSLKMLIDDFKGLGVQVTTDGDLPASLPLRRTFFEIATEAMSNAVRHGYATEIRIAVREDDSGTSLVIRDNGLCPDGPILEGGGFAGMRRKAQKLGGSFRYDPHAPFTITIHIPKGMST